MNAQWNQNLPLRLERKTSWAEISLAHYRLGPGSLPEHQQDADLVIASLDG